MCNLYNKHDSLLCDTSDTIMEQIRSIAAPLAQFPTKKLQWAWSMVGWCWYPHSEIASHLIGPWNLA
jgi:hypothetical protein